MADVTRPTYDELVEENERLRHIASGEDVPDEGSRMHLYVWIIFGLATVEVLAIVVLNLFGHGDVAAIDRTVATIKDIFYPLLAGFGAAALRENYRAQNSRLTQVVRITRTAARAEGKLAAEHDQLRQQQQQQP